MIPENIAGAIIRYIVWGLRPGSGTRAILSNNLKETAACCDDETWDSVRLVLSWLYLYAPSECYGSPEKVAAWREKDLSAYTELRDGLTKLGANIAIEHIWGVTS